MVTNFIPPILLLLGLPLSSAFSMHSYMDTTCWIYLALHACDFRANHLVLDNQLGSYSMWGDYFSHRQNSLATYSSLSRSEVHEIFPFKLTCLFFVASQRLKVSPCYWRHHVLLTQGSEDLSWTETLSLRTSFHRTRSCYANYQWGKVTNKSYSNAKTMIHNNDQHDKISLKVQWWHSSLGGNQQMSNWLKAFSASKKTCLELEA